MPTTATDNQEPSPKKQPKPKGAPATPPHMHIMRVIEKQRVDGKLIVYRRCLYYPACKHTDVLEM